MYFEAITSQSADVEKVQTLYEAAFPANERSPFHLLLDDFTGCSEILALYEDACFCGFLSLFTLGDISHIIYFATEPAMRGKGCGARALALLREYKPGYRLLADIEAPENGATQDALRVRRKRFYLKNGYQDAGVGYEWRDEQYEILISGGTLTEREFWGFWEAVSRVNAEFARF